MTTFAVLVEVRLRPGIADPQGSTIERSLPTLGFEGIEGVRVGKAIRFSVEAPDEPTARARVDDLCTRFLTNPVIEDAEVTLSVSERSERAIEHSALRAEGGSVTPTPPKAVAP